MRTAAKTVRLDFDARDADDNKIVPTRGEMLLGAAKALQRVLESMPPEEQTSSLQLLAKLFSPLSQAADATPADEGTLTVNRSFRNPTTGLVEDVLILTGQKAQRYARMRNFGVELEDGPIIFFADI